MSPDTLSIPDVKLIALRRFEDLRGFFSETYNKAVLAGYGVEADRDHNRGSGERAAA